MAGRPSRAGEEVPPCKLSRTVRAVGAPGRRSRRCRDRQGGPLRRPALHVHATVLLREPGRGRPGEGDLRPLHRPLRCASPAPSSAASHSESGAASSSSTARSCRAPRPRPPAQGRPARPSSTRSPANLPSWPDHEASGGGFGGRASWRSPPPLADPASPVDQQSVFVRPQAAPSSSTERVSERSERTSEVEIHTASATHWTKRDAAFGDVAGEYGSAVGHVRHDDVDAEFARAGRASAPAPHVVGGRTRSRRPIWRIVNPASVTNWRGSPPMTPSRLCDVVAGPRHRKMQGLALAVEHVEERQPAAGHERPAHLGVHPRLGREFMRRVLRPDDGELGVLARQRRSRRRRGSRSGRRDHCGG